MVSSEITNYEWKSRTIVLSKLFLMALPLLNSSQGNFYQMIDMKVAHPLPRLWPFKNSLERHKCKEISMAEGEKCIRRRVWGHRTGDVVQATCTDVEGKESLVAQVVKNPLSMQETQVQSLGWEDPLKKEEWLPTPVFLPGELHGHRSLGRLQSMGSQTVRCDWMTNSFALFSLFIEKWCLSFQL